MIEGLASSPNAHAAARGPAAHQHGGGWPELALPPGAARRADRAESFWHADAAARRRAEAARILVAVTALLAAALVPVLAGGFLFISIVHVDPSVVTAAILITLAYGVVSRWRMTVEPTVPRVGVAVPLAIRDISSEMSVAAGMLAPRIVVADQDEAVPWARWTDRELTIVLDVEPIPALDRAEWGAITALLIARSRLVGPRRLRLRYHLVDLLLFVEQAFFPGILLERELWSGPWPGYMNRVRGGLSGSPIRFIGGAILIVLGLPIILPCAVIRWLTRQAVRALLAGTIEEVLRADADAVALARDPRALAWALDHLTEPAPRVADDIHDLHRRLPRAAYYAVPPSHARSGATGYDFPPLAERVIRLRAIGGA